jgi:peptidoglycan/LPS O-acetylase OafA/YrhL
MENKPVGFSDNLAALRGVAATAVVVFHALLIFRVAGYDDPHRLPFDTGSGWLLLNHILLGLVNGHAAVILFFVLSGTVLALSLARTPRLTLTNLSGYYVRRALRLGPPLITVSVAAALLHIYYFDNTGFAATTSWMGEYYRHVPTLTEVSRNAAGLSDSLNAPAWTIRVEIAASIVFPFLYLASLRDRLVWPVLAVLTLILFLPVPASGLVNYFICFFIGALIPRFGAAVARAYFDLPRAIRLVVLGTALATMGWFERVSAPELHMDPAEVMAMTIAAAFLVAIVYYGPARPWLQTRTALFLGEVSYGIYLIHFGVLFAIAHAVAPHVGPLAPAEALALNLALAAATLAVTVPLAALSYYGLERPCQQLGRIASRRIAFHLSAGRTVGVPQDGLRSETANEAASVRGGAPQLGSRP